MALSPLGSTPCYAVNSGAHDDLDEQARILAAMARDDNDDKPQRLSGPPLNGARTRPPPVPPRAPARPPKRRRLATPTSPPPRPPPPHAVATRTTRTLAYLYIYIFKGDVPKPS